VLPGDIVPHTAIERVIAIFIQLAGAVFLALVIGTVGARLARGGGGEGAVFLALVSGTVGARLAGLWGWKGRRRRGAWMGKGGFAPPPCCFSPELSAPAASPPQP